MVMASRTAGLMLLLLTCDDDDDLYYNSSSAAVLDAAQAMHGISMNVQPQ